MFMPICRAIERKFGPGEENYAENVARGENYTDLGRKLCERTYYCFVLFSIEISVSGPRENPPFDDEIFLILNN